MATLLLLLMLHGLFLAGVLIAARRRSPGNVQLAALQVVVAALLFQAWLGWEGPFENDPDLRSLFRPLWFSIGPLILLYIRRFTGAPPLPRDRLLALPPLAMAAHGLFIHLRPTDTAPATPSHASADLGVLIAFTLLTGGCAWVAWRTMGRIEPTETAPHTPRSWRHAWLRWLMGALLAYACLDFVSAVSLALRGGYPPVLLLVSLGLMTALVYSTGLVVALPDGLLTRAPWPGRKYRRSTLDADVASRQLDALTRLMRDTRPWLDEDLRLDQLATRLGTNRHQLSQLINQHLGTSFHDYVNRHRVDEARRLLLDAGSQRSMLDIGLAAGFGSNASFYRAFKKHVGLTPRDFLSRTAGSKAEPIRKRAESS